jgi:hypothetical protein
MRRHAERVFVVGFEHLIRDPAGTLKATCEFLGEEFDQGMLAVADNNSSFRETRSRPGLRAEVLDRKHRLGAREHALIELLCGEAMLAEGYTPAVVPSGAVRLLSSLRGYAISQRLHGLARERRHGRRTGPLR